MVPSRQFHTIPLGPQLQALWRTRDSANNIRYRRRRTAEIFEEICSTHTVETYDDFFTGFVYIEAVREGTITDNDMLLMLSLDGAQLYQSKQSDCWVYIWVILDHSPDVRYKRKQILISAVIPGPNKPNNVDSFLFPGLHHLTALQKEGLCIWDAIHNVSFISKLFFALGTADTPGMVYLNGLVGHHGAYACCLYCPNRGRHKPGATCYYPALLKPVNYDVDGCSHGDVDVRFLPSTSADEYHKNLDYIQLSPNETQYKERRKQTGISRPSIFLGLPCSLGVPGCFPTDLMHLASLNLTDLLLSLWRATIDCDRTDSKMTWSWAVLQGSEWKVHGDNVAKTLPYLPGSFDRPPRNPAEKINSGYKAWEFLTYVYGLAPALLKDILPSIYWHNFCKLVVAIRLLHQHSITSRQLQAAHHLLIAFHEEYELLYYQRRVDRLHFCRPSIHTLTHLAPEVYRLGPASYHLQWTLERVIGALGSEIKQPSKPYANLSQRAVRWCQVNALRAMAPELQSETRLPYGAMDLGDGYILLRARDNSPQEISGPQNAAIISYAVEHSQADTASARPASMRLIRWACLRLPNGQIAQSAWKENAKTLKHIRMARNVKVSVFSITLDSPYRLLSIF